MKRPPEYYTLWNQAVEAVEIYLARNPRELTETGIHTLCDYMLHRFYADRETGRIIDPLNQENQDRIDNVISLAATL
jgi:hypothetical protein